MQFSNSNQCQILQPVSEYRFMQLRPKAGFSRFVTFWKDFDFLLCILVN